MTATPPPRPMPVPWARLGLAAGIVALPPAMFRWTGPAELALWLLLIVDAATLGAVLFSLGRCALALNRGAWRPARDEAGMAVLMLAAAASPLAWLMAIGIDRGD